MREDTERYHILFSLTHDIMFSYDTQLKLTYVSPNVESATGYTPEELIGKTIRDVGLLHAESVHKAQENALRVLSGETIPPSVYRFISKDGTDMFVEVSGRPIREDGRITGVVSVAKDIILRRQAEESLQESELKARAILDHTFQFIGLMTTDGTLIEANRSALSFSGLTASDVLGRPFWDTPWWMHSAALQKRLRAAVKKAARGKFVRFEASHPAADGTLHDIDFSLKPVTDATGHVVYLIPEGRDITDRKRMEEELKRHRDHLEILVKERTAELTLTNEQMKQEIAERQRVERALLDSEENYRTHFSLTSDVLYVLDDQFRVVSVSPSVENAIGYRPEELVGRPFQELGVLDPEFLDAAANDALRVLSGESISASVYRFITVHGTRIFGEVSGVPLVRNGRVAGVISLARDVTSREHTEEELKKHRDHLEEMVKERTLELTRANDRLKREIAKQKRTENSLKERQARLDSIFRAAPIAIGVTMDRIMQEVNDRICEMTGYSRDELIGQSSHMLYPSQKEFDRVGAGYRRLLLEQGTGHMESRWKCKDGGIIDVLLSITPIIPEDPSSGVMFTALDISKRTRAEKELRTLNKKLENIIEFLPDATFIMDRDKRIIAWNRAMEEMTGVSKEHIIGKDHAQSTIPFYGEARPYLMDLLEKDDAEMSSRYDFVKKHGNAVYAEVFAPALNSGRGAYVWAVASPLYDSDGAVIGAIESIRDITEHKKTMAALRESEGKYRFLTEKMNDIIWTTGMNLQITYDSPSVEKVTGYTPEERMQQNPADMLTPESYRKVVEVIRRELERDREDGVAPDRSVTLELEYYHKNGSTVWVECVASPIRDSSGAPVGIHGVSRDITDRKRAEDELARHRDRLEEMVRERTADLTRTYERLRQENEARKATENELRAREIELEETNSALRTLLNQRDEDKAGIEETIMTNIKTTLFPYIEKLKGSGLKEGQMACLSEIELHLRDIASPYIRKISSEHIGLSPCEIQVATLIKEGKSSKEIAEILSVSLNTVLTHRFCIRKKTGLKGRKINLTSYLQTLT